MLACLNGEFETVKFLIDNGAKVNFTQQEGYTAFMLACSKGEF